MLTQYVGRLCRETPTVGAGVLWASTERDKVTKVVSIQSSPNGGPSGELTNYTTTRM